MKAEEIKAMIELLGEDNVQRLKDSFTDIIIKRFEDDLDSYGSFLIYPPDILATMEDAEEAVQKKIEKMYKEAVVDINRSYIEKVKQYMADDLADKDFRRKVIDFIRKYWWRGNQYSTEYKLTRELAEILKISQDEIEEKSV